MTLTRDVSLRDLFRGNFIIRLFFARLRANSATFRNTLRLFVRNLLSRPYTINSNVRGRILLVTLRDLLLLPTSPKSCYG